MSKSEEYIDKYTHTNNEDHKFIFMDSAKTAFEMVRIEGVLLGLQICKKMWNKGTINHENISEEIIFYTEELEKLIENE